jgi:hypothetical protein
MPKEVLHIYSMEAIICKADLGKSTIGDQSQYIEREEP